MSDTNRSTTTNQNEINALVLESSIHGYRVSDINTISSRFLCVFCKLIIREAVQLINCGHRCCHACFRHRVERASDRNILCPDPECSEVSNESEIMIDKAFQRELNGLLVVCFHRDEHCDWTGRLQDYQTHLDQIHTNFECSKCHENFTNYDLLLIHQGFKCPAIFQSCALAPACGHELILIDQLESHYKSVSHQEAINNIIVGKYVFENPVESKEELDSKAVIAQWESDTEKSLKEQKEKTQSIQSECVEISERQKRVQELCQLKALELQETRAKLEEHKSTRLVIQENQRRSQKETQEIQEQFDNSQQSVTDGTLTWRVDNLANRMADAQSERQTSIYSPIFYSSPTGYKMRARLFLFGDGNARRTHMSLFFLLMKGEYDAVLKWPFGYKIIFCLLDQSGGNNHLIDSFHPDVKSSSFQRPKTESNVANGIPKFCPLTTIQQDGNIYVREDVLYLKIIVELNDAIKGALPYVLTLNPALPLHIREQLIQQEAKKRQQAIASPVVTN